MHRILLVLVNIYFYSTQYERSSFVCFKVQEVVRDIVRSEIQQGNVFNFQVGLF